jgi:hypothetical protein
MKYQGNEGGIYHLPLQISKVAWRAKSVIFAPPHRATNILSIARLTRCDPLAQRDGDNTRGDERGAGRCFLTTSRRKTGKLQRGNERSLGRERSLDVSSVHWAEQMQRQREVYGKPGGAKCLSLCQSLKRYKCAASLLATAATAAQFRTPVSSRLKKADLCALSSGW